MEEIKTIGELLRETREASGLTLKQIATKTKINLSVLKSLENEDIQKLPNVTYVKGFVKNYAKAINLDPDLAIKTLNKLYEVKEEVKPEQLENNTVHVSSPVPELNLETKSETEAQVEEIKEGLIVFIQSLFKKKVLFSAAAIIIFIIILKLIAGWFSQLSNEPTADTIKKEATSTTQIQTTPLPETALDITEDLNEETKEVPTQDLISPQADTVVKTEVVAEELKPETIENEVPEIAIKEDKVTTQVVETKKEPEPTKEIKVTSTKFPYKRFRPAPLKLFDAIADAPEVKNPNLLPASIKASAIQGKQNIYIVADTADSWISYKVDNNPIKRYVLRKGRRVFIKGDRVLLFVGNYNETKVFYNNMYVSAQTSSGVKSLIFPPEAAKTLVLPMFPSFNGIPYEASEYIKKMDKQPDSSL